MASNSTLNTNMSCDDNICSRVKTLDQFEDVTLDVGCVFINLHFELQLNSSQFLGY